MQMIAHLLEKAKRDEVVGTKVLVASLDPKFSQIVQADKSSYEKFYSNTFEGLFKCVGALHETIARGYDIVHLCCDVVPSGRIVDTTGEAVGGTSLIKTCSESGVK